MTSWCPRCGNVGFHSEACIAATSAERIAAQQMATLHDCSEARALGRAEALAAIEQAVTDRRIFVTYTGSIAYVPLADVYRVLAAIDNLGRAEALADPAVIDAYLDSISVMTAARLREKWPASSAVIRAEALAERGDEIDVERLARAIDDHDDICSSMAIPECAPAIAREYAALASPDSERPA